MQSQAERTLRMKENYVELHKQGLSPQEIAARFYLSSDTVYRHLQEIADKAGVSRKSLLQVPHPTHIYPPPNFSPLPPVDTQKFQAHARALSGNLRGLLADVARDLTTLDKTTQAIEKEEMSWQQS